MQVKIKDYIIYLDRTEKHNPWIVKKKDDYNYRSGKWFNSFEDAFEYVRTIYPEKEDNFFKSDSLLFLIGGMIVGTIIGSVVTWWSLNI